ncbi:MAG: nucleoside kinase [Paludibacteraceae bacterium]|nr:nucleoside kinase [Paludibacteraceae bacterium]
MENTVTIYCKNNKQYYDIQRGTALLDVYRQIGLQLPYPVVCARVNYKTQDLTFLVYKPKDIEFLDASCPSGMRCYVRTLEMVMAYAVRSLYPHTDLLVEHPISKGYYCTLRNFEGTNMPVTQDVINAISERMQELIRADKPIVTEEKQTKEVIRLFKECHDAETTLFQTLGNPYCRYFRIDDFIDYYTSALMPSTGYLNVYKLELFHEGILLRIPNRVDPTRLEESCNQDKMFGIFNEYTSWNKLLKISNVGEFNNACKGNKSFEMIKLSEALHEKKVAQIADMIVKKEGGMPKFVLISGPSSSGKTTFSKRLTIQMLVNGIRPVILSMDNYFVNREDTPKDENGDWDFEDINALDLPFFRQQVADLLEGKEVALPTFNFETGKREMKGDKLQLKSDTVVILEGLHALNPKLLPDIPRDKVFKIYVSSLTTVNLDNHNWIPTTDVRLIRRIVRDYRYRGYSARDTINRCPSVRRGEVKWIYPFQEEADAMFNSSLLFELAVLKRHAEPILADVPKYCDEYAEAHRLLKFLSYFESIPEKEIPPTSFLREFVGGSSFRY